MAKQIELLFSIAFALATLPETAYFVWDEEFSNLKLRGHPQSWLHRSMHLSNWLLDERDRFKAKPSTKTIEVEGRSYGIEAYETLQNRATEYYRQHPQVDSRTWFYFLFIEWYVHVLNEFDRLMQGKLLRETSYWNTYQENVGKLTSLLELLRKERSNLSYYEDWDKVEREIPDDLEGAVKKLAIRWREMVFRTVENEFKSSTRS